MTVISTVLIAVTTAAIFIFGAFRISMFLTDRQEALGKKPWHDSGHGNSDGYADFGGGDCGGGGD